MRIFQNERENEMSRQVATITPGTSVIQRVATRFGVDPDKMLHTLKSTAFRAKDGEISNEQMMALLVVADQHKLNPWTKEIYAFPDKQNGIVPVVGVDGWARIINEHEQFDGMEFQQDDDSCTCAIYRKDRSHPTAVTEYMSECKRDTGPWKSHPRRMLRHKAMIQCARLAFGFGGIYDQDEAERIIDPNAIDSTATRVAPKAPAAKRQQSTTITEKQLGLLLDRCAAADITARDLADHLDIEALDQLPFERMDEALAAVTEIEGA